MAGVAALSTQTLPLSFPACLHLSIPLNLLSHLCTLGGAGEIQKTKMCMIQLHGTLGNVVLQGALWRWMQLWTTRATGTPERGGESTDFPGFCINTAVWGPEWYRLLVPVCAYARESGSWAVSEIKLCLAVQESELERPVLGCRDQRQANEGQICWALSHQGSGSWGLQTHKHLGQGLLCARTR